MARGFLDGRIEAGCKIDFTLRGGGDGCRLSGGDGNLFILEDGGGEGEGECEGDLFSRMSGGDFGESSDDRDAEEGGNGGAPWGLNGGPDGRRGGGGGTVDSLFPGGGGGGRRGALAEVVSTVVLLASPRPLSSHLRRLVSGDVDISSGAVSTETGHVSQIAISHQFAAASASATHVATDPMGFGSGSVPDPFPFSKLLHYPPVVSLSLVRSCSTCACLRYVTSIRPCTRTNIIALNIRVRMRYKQKVLLRYSLTVE